MKTYRWLTKSQLIEKIADAKVEQIKKENFQKFGNNDFPRVNENRQNWIALLRTYPIKSKTPFCLSKEYEYFYGE